MWLGLQGFLKGELLGGLPQAPGAVGLRRVTVSMCD